MDCKTLAIWLTVAGGAAELGGLALVAFGIFKDRAKARALFAVHKVRLEPARSYGRSGTIGTLTGGREPTTEERLESVEASVKGLGEQVDDRFFDARKRTDAQIDEALKQAYAADKEIDDDLRRGLADVLAGGIRGRVVGVALLLAGISLSVAWQLGRHAVLNRDRRRGAHWARPSSSQPIRRQRSSKRQKDSSAPQ